MNKTSQDILLPELGYPTGSMLKEKERLSL